MVAPIGALNIFMAIVALLCIVMGILGFLRYLLPITCHLLPMPSYLRYGTSTAASISLNLPRGDPLSEAALCLYCLDIILSYPIQFYVIMDIIGQSPTQSSAPTFMSILHIINANL